MGCVADSSVIHLQFTIYSGKLRSLAYRFPSSLVSIDWTYPEGTNVSSFWDVHTLESTNNYVGDDETETKDPDEDAVDVCVDVDEISSNLSSNSRGKSSKMSLGTLLLSNELEFVYEITPVPGISDALKSLLYPFLRKMTQPRTTCFTFNSRTIHCIVAGGSAQKESEAHAYLVPVMATALEAKLRESVVAVQHQVFRTDGMGKNSNTPRYAVELLLQKHENGRISAKFNSAVYNIRDNVDFEYKKDGNSLRLLVCQMHFT